MQRRHTILVGVVAALVLSVNATTCNSTNPCPASAPCCSEFGFCGSDDFCLGGCNPLASKSLDSCMPAPMCQDATHTFADNSRILTKASFFDGNASAYDFVVDKGTIMNTNSSGGELALLLTKDNGGTRISSTRHVHYGTITARLKTGRWGGVVTAFITMSGIKDEVDWEFPGATVTEGQSNFFWQGVIPDGHNNGETHKGISDTFANYHDYTIDWQPDALTFGIDGKTVRTIRASDTTDGGVIKYPTTPARVQLSIWPAGIEGSPPGTVEWAGGMINWDDPDYKAAGQFYTLVKSISIKCADPTKAGKNITSYVYGGNSTKDTPSVAFSNQTTLLNGALSVGPAGTGLNVGMALAMALDDLVFATAVYRGGGLDGNDPMMPVLELATTVSETDDMPTIEFDDMPPRYLSVAYYDYYYCTISTACSVTGNGGSKMNI
ncbi:hypothetical protein EYR40_010697 [Pleurotus pulmonarius]|nr:hypothetical protein EYR40_010697 [Pleurotus pulmonarius]